MQFRLFRSRLLATTLCAAGALVLTGCETALTEPVASDVSEFVIEAVQPISADPEIAALIAEMTLDEKLAQISCIWFNKAQVLDENGDFSPEKMKTAFPHGVGCFARPQDTIGWNAAAQEEERDVNDATVVRR